LSLAVLFILLCFVVAWLRGGRLKEDLELSHMWLAPAAFGLQLINYFLVPTRAQVYVTLVSYLLLLALAVTNRKVQGVRLLMVGMMLNALVMGLNGGRIPVDIETGRAIGMDVSELEEGVASKWAPLVSESRLPFLGDVIPLRFPIRRMVSLGDLIAAAGAFLLIQDLMGRRVITLWSEETNSLR
jgi:hypothetical protein